MNKLRSGDEVIILVGKDKGKRGFISSVYQNKKALVDGVNVVKKHVKPNPNAGVEGGIVSKEMPIDISNIAIVNPDTGKADRVGFKFEKKVKVRFFKSNGKAIPISKATKSK